MTEKNSKSRHTIIQSTTSSKWTRGARAHGREQMFFDGFFSSLLSGDEDAGVCHPFVEIFVPWTNSSIQNRCKNSASCPSTRMECSDTPSRLTSKLPIEHAVSPTFLHVDMIAHGQDGCPRQCIFEISSHRIADTQIMLVSRHYRAFSVGW